MLDNNDRNSIAMVIVTDIKQKNKRHYRKKVESTKKKSKYLWHCGAYNHMQKTNHTPVGYSVQQNHALRTFDFQISWRAYFRAFYCCTALASAYFGVSHNNRFFRPKVNGRIAFSVRLSEIEASPVSRYATRCYF